MNRQEQATGCGLQAAGHAMRAYVSCHLLPVACCLLCGCQSLSMNLEWPWDKVELPAPPKENWVYRAGHWEQQPVAPPGTLAGDFASAKILFEQGSYADAEKVFRKLQKKAEKEKNADIVEDSLFMEAECQYAQREFRKARENYHKLLTEFPSSRHRNDTIARQYDIAEYWLDDTRYEMEAWREYDEGKRWLVVPTVFHLEKEKPFIDEEGHALKACEAVYTQDPAGPLAPKALYLAGGVNYFREDYGDADMYYSMLVDQYPKSPLAPKALELAIQSKIQVTGGPDYDGRKLAEARQLAMTALRSYPELQDKREFLERTLISINEQQAEKDFRVAELYRRMGRNGSAYFCYELVRRRYSGTEWANKATERMLELRAKVESENGE